MKKMLLLLFLIGILPSCKDNKGLVQTFVNQCNLIRIEDKTFVLDDETTQNFDCLQFYRTNDLESKLFFNNTYDNSIVEYDFASSRFIRKIKFHKEGPDGVGSSFFFRCLNQDTILIYNYAMQRLFMADCMGKVFDKRAIKIDVNLLQDSLFMGPGFISTRTNNPMIKIGDEILLSGFLPKEQKGENGNNRPVLAWYHLKDNKIRYSDCYPEIYHKGNWGGSFSYRNPSYTLNDRNELVLSFAADLNIRVSELGYAQREYRAGFVSPKPVMDEMIYPGDKDERHFFRSISYECIHYDSARKLYYRLVTLPLEGEIPKKRPVHKPLALIVLDSDFEMIGYFELPKADYLPNNCFVSSDGFHVQVVSDNDDILRFATFMVE